MAMAGDWIPRCKGLNRKPEVLQIAKATGIHRRIVSDTLMEFWEWADSETTDGNLAGLTVAQLCDAVPGTDETFWLAVVQSNWLEVHPSGIKVPNYDRWLGENAKKRLQNTRRKRLSRENDVSRKKRDKSATTGQDRTLFSPIGENNPPTPLTEAEIELAASRLVLHYQETVQPDHSTARGETNVSGLLRKGIPEQQLLLCAEGYAAACDKRKTEAAYRKSVGNFYGRDAVYKEFLECIPQKDPSEMTPEERAEVKRKIMGQQRR